MAADSGESGVVSCQLGGIDVHADVSELLARFTVSDAARDFIERNPKMYIDGEFVDSSSGETFQLIEPSTGKPLAEVPHATVDDLDTAVAAARRALKHGPWATMKPNERQRILLRLADLLEENKQTAAEIETIDNGKAITGCLIADVEGSADLIRFMAGMATKIEGATRNVSAEGEHFAMTLKEPIGVVGAIIPWNFPLNTACWKMAAALAAGCTIVVKPAEITPLSTLYFATLAQEAGLPPGVLNVVTGGGREIGARLAGHPDVDKVSFTGSTNVGRSVGVAASQSLSPATLELGGKSPMIAFEDADLAALAENTKWSVYFTTGQVCSAGTRVYIHRSIWDEALETISKVASGMKIAPGLDPQCEVGPVVSQAQFESIMKYIEIGKDEGARLICGGNAIEGDGYFIEPTLFAIDDNDARIVQEEIFGPVLVAIPFDTEEEAIAMANDNEYALAASVWTKDVSRALRCVRLLEAGTVWVNAHDLLDSALPFGGFKNSGFGKDLGPEQLDHFLRTKTAWVALQEFS